MDRRTKLVIFILLALTAFGLVGWFIVWPTLKPILPSPVAQPPALPAPNPPVQNTNGTQPSSNNGSTSNGGAVATFDPVPVSPDATIIANLERRASVLSERVESGSSENGFANLDDAQLDVSPTLAARFRTLKSELQKAHPASGSAFVTVARHLTSKGESDVINGSTFNVTVQLQVQTRDAGKTSSGYIESTVTFTQSGEEWLTSAYTSKPFTP